MPNAQRLINLNGSEGEQLDRDVGQNRKVTDLTKPIGVSSVGK